MKKAEALIFDMDGTLYSFDKAQAGVFTASRFGQSIHNNCVQFFADKFALNSDQAEKMYLDFKQRYNGEVSLGLEQEQGIPRAEYFSRTWDLDPAEFILLDEKLVQAIGLLTIKTGVLSAAPRVWVDRVLEFMQLRQIFEPAVFTGDPDIRKPHPQAFLQLAEWWQLDPSTVVSIGDQEETDIVPAKTLGMTTVRIGKEVPTTADFSAGTILEALALLKNEGIL